MKKQDFFARSSALVAKDLMGCGLVVAQDGEVSRHQITEVEAYLGEEDDASHACFGQTARTELMYGPAGVLYVYLIYGMHHMLNIITGPAGEPQAVLIRGIKGADGPGKLTSKLGISKGEHNGKPLGKESGIWIEDRPADFDAGRIEETSRIGIEYASQEWREKPLRFVLSGK